MTKQEKLRYAAQEARIEGLLAEMEQTIEDLDPGEEALRKIGKQCIYCGAPNYGKDFHLDNCVFSRFLFECDSAEARSWD